MTLKKGSKVKVVPLPGRRRIMAPWNGRTGVVQQVGSARSQHEVLVHLDLAEQVTPAMQLANVSVAPHDQWFADEELEVVT